MLKERGVLQSYYHNEADVIQEERAEQNSRHQEKSGNRTNSLACSEEMSENSFAFHNHTSSRGTNSFSDTVSVAKECSSRSTL